MYFLLGRMAVKSKFIKILVLVFVFAGVVAAVLFFNRNDSQKEAYAEWKEASLPVLYMNFEGERINSLHGYTADMDKTYMRDTITPVASDRNITVSVDSYGSHISGVSYQVYSLDGEKLYIKKDCTGYEASEGSFDVSFALEDIFDAATEYQLILTLTSDEYKAINYYTRIRYYDDTDISGILSYVKDFSNDILSGDLSSEHRYQLESDSSTDNSSYGYTDIKSTYSHVSWGNLSPELVSDVSISIKEFNEMTGSVELKYAVNVQNEDRKTVTLDVDEFFCVRYVNNAYYLIAYEREANERFTFTEERINSDGVELGITAKKYLPLNVVSKGSLNVFSVDGELWCFDSVKNNALKLFSFKQEENDERTLLDEHKFDVVSIDGDGNIQFTVSGYMNSGLHEGKCGIAFYKYTKADNRLDELFFIQSRRSADVVNEEVDRLSYMGKNNMYYIVFGGSLYAIDFGGMEYVKIAEGLSDGTYAIDPENGIAAWQESDKHGLGTSVREFFLDDSSEYKIKADDGEYLKVIGFLDGDLIVGRAHTEDIVMEGLAVAGFPMYRIDIINKEHETVTQYNGNGFYISGAEISNDRVVIQRMVRNEDGSFSGISDDVLLRNADDDQSDSKIVSAVGDLRKRIYSLKLNSVSTSKEFTITNPEHPGSVTGYLSIAETEEGKQDGRYYAFSCGRLQGITDSAGNAINMVYDQMGTVVDGKQNYIWTRANRSARKQIQVSVDYAAGDNASTLAACINTVLDLEDKKTNAEKLLGEGKSAYDILNSSLGSRALNLQGCLMNQVIYYVNNGSPVIAYTAKDKAELIVGFTGNSQIIMYDTLSRSNYTMSWQDAENLFNANGNIFISYVK